MTYAALLALLAITDCTLCGFRGAAGRDGRLAKGAYYRGAVVRALGLGVVIVGLHVLLAALLLASSPAPLWDGFVVAARTCVLVYTTFATTILVAFGFYFAPIGDFRVLTNVIVFGPLTLLRPWVIAFGLALAVVRVPEPRLGVLAVVAGVSMLSFQRLVARPYANRWRSLVK